MHRSAIVLLLLALVLSGCASSPDAGDGAAPSADDGAAPDLGSMPVTTANGTVLPWSMQACRHVVWWPAVETVSVQDRVPEGFQAQGGNPSFGGPLGFEAFQCTSGAGLNDTVADLEYGSIFIGVNAPDEYGCAQLSGGCYVKTDVLVPDAPRRDLLIAHGVPARDGKATVSALAAGPGTAALDLGETGTFSASFVATGQMGNSAGLPFLEFTTANGGVSVWSATTDDASQESVQGTWSASPGSWVAQAFGVTQGPAFVNVGTWSFSDGSITLPA